ncbi:ATP-binding cassette domain-containing protein, partial [Candidatus Bathyarchaeota archaeon]|nr:ATP-binding cassette domain-containing protein [Candidatus Bathyarchaeota archaeon]
IGSFTLNDVKLEKRFKGELPLENIKWQIGAIVGRSGTGKTTIAKQLFPDKYIKNLEYTRDSILDDFAESLGIKEVTRALCSVGFASPPDWLKSYSCLSQGEKMRVDVARTLCLQQQLVVFDEFTALLTEKSRKSPPMQ